MPEVTPQPIVNPPASQNEQPPSETPATFDAWLATQSDTVKTLYQQHTAGLQNTVKATRQERDELAKQIKELLPTVEKGSKTEAALLEMQTRYEVAERRASFFEDAAKPEIGCHNSRLAWVLAQSENLFDRKGNPDWAAIKAAAPELFGAPSVQANAGTGTQNPPKTATMNDLILRAAGRR